MSTIIESPARTPLVQACIAISMIVRAPREALALAAYSPRTRAVAVTVVAAHLAVAVTVGAGNVLRTVDAMPTGGDQMRVAKVLVRYHATQALVSGVAAPVAQWTLQTICFAAAGATLGVYAPLGSLAEGVVLASVPRLIGKAGRTFVARAWPSSAPCMTAPGITCVLPATTRGPAVVAARHADPFEAWGMALLILLAAERLKTSMTASTLVVGGGWITVLLVRAAVTNW